MALTVLKVKNAKPGRHVDGRGSVLVVKPSGARTWVLRMQLKGHRRDYGLGSAHDVSLTDAQKQQQQNCAAGSVRALILLPSGERRARIIPNFEAATRTRAMKPWGTDGRMGITHVAVWLRAPPLSPHRQEAGRSSGQRLRRRGAVARYGWRYRKQRAALFQRIGVVLDFAHVKGWVPEEVSLRSVRKGLPRQNDKRGHMEAMPYADVPALMQKLAVAAPTTGRDALRFTIYNAVRSNETRFAVWTEFDSKRAWTIPSRTDEGTGNPYRAAYRHRL
jgi:hypothetical protein